MESAVCPVGEVVLGTTGSTRVTRGGAACETVLCLAFVIQVAPLVTGVVAFAVQAKTFAMKAASFLIQGGALVTQVIAFVVQVGLLGKQVAFFVTKGALG